jgi:hypothetical protein
MRALPSGQALLHVVYLPLWSHPADDSFVDLGQELLFEVCKKLLELLVGYLDVITL